MVVAHEDGESYLKAKEDRRDYLYGVVDGQIGDNGVLTLVLAKQAPVSKARTIEIK